MLEFTCLGCQVKRITRTLLARVKSTLDWSPVVFVEGPRQTGKTVLVRDMLGALREATYVTFDDMTALAAVKSDPQGYVLSFFGPVSFDEAQRVPEIVLPIKLSVDRERTPGRFVLTGSARIRFLRGAGDSLAGRAVALTLWPLSQGELAGVRERFVDHVFAGGSFAHGTAQLRDIELVDRLVRGGYPQSVLSRSPHERSEWARQLVRAIVEQDVRDVVPISDTANMLQFVLYLAASSAELTNMDKAARDLGMVSVTLSRYLDLLEMVFLVQRIRPWRGNHAKRLVKSPKVLFVDTGLACAVMNADVAQLQDDRPLFGRMLESFVGMELVKQFGWSEGAYTLMHYRDHAGVEVDWVIERADGKVVGIEVKSTTSPGPDDFKGMRSFARAAGDRFVGGVVLHAGDTTLKMGEKMWALPVDALWGDYPA